MSFIRAILSALDAWLTILSVIVGIGLIVLLVALLVDL